MMANEIITKSGLRRSDFYREVDGYQHDLVVLTNANGMELCVTNQGAKVVSLMVPDRDGRLVDVVLGFSTLEDYLTTTEIYYGAICGRSANRMAYGRFIIDGVEYQVPCNAGEHGLHGGDKGFNLAFWQMRQLDSQRVEMSYTSPDGEMGYPGALTTHIIYELTDANEWIITYEATTTKPTPLNITQHSFFNLSGQDQPTILDHEVQINADFFTPTDAFSIPSGEVRPLEGTPMDFRTPHTIGARIEEPYEPLLFGKGNDHNYVLNKRYSQEYSYAAYARSPQTGIKMQMYTTEPATQLYTGNWIAEVAAKSGARYQERCALCFEAQHFPDAPNHPHFATTILRPGQVYKQKTGYIFTID